jgi:hypothetical protein
LYTHLVCITCLYKETTWTTAAGTTRSFGCRCDFGLKGCGVGPMHRACVHLDCLSVPHDPRSSPVRAANGARRVSLPYWWDS